MFETDPLLEFDEQVHQYSYKKNPMTSVTKFLSSFEPVFETEKISWFVARKQLRDELQLSKTDPDPDKELINAKAELVRMEWDARRDGAAEHGTIVHNMMEQYFNNRIVLYPKTESFLYNLKQEYDKIYKEYRCEVRIFNEGFRIAGTMDIPLLRNCKEPVLDIEDFKSNMIKGIYFDSISRKEGKLKHYNSYFLAPMTHMEICNYNRYVLQLSTYAYLCELLYKVKIGRLAIRWIEFNQESEEIEFSSLIPIPYLRSDVMQLCKQNKQAEVHSIEKDW